MTSAGLLVTLQFEMARWSAENWGALAAAGKGTPTSSGFREGLIRLGLKHLDDPEFIDLIPPDGRRRRGRMDAPPL